MPYETTSIFQARVLGLGSYSARVCYLVRSQILMSNMLYHKPNAGYSGLSIVLSNPSRFDKSRLLSGYAGQFFSSTCLMPLPLTRCEVRLVDDSRPLLEGTKVILALGEHAATKLIPLNHSLHEQRGCPWLDSKGIIYLASYFPQDCMDIRDFEGDFHKTHEILEDEHDAQDEQESSLKGELGEKSRSVTKRQNWRFWLEQDTKKAVRLLAHPELFTSCQIFQTKIYPSAEETEYVLRTYKNQDLYFDIETNESLQLTCFSFSFSDTQDVYVIPVTRYNRTLAYDTCHLAKILRALVVAIHNNQVVIHNSMFDLFVLAYTYGLPYGHKVFDTMLAHARLYPDTEKSLGHCISLYTYEPFHKGEGIFDPKNENQERQLWSYNGKDVSTLRLVKEGLLKRARAQGAESSINQVNASIPAYLTMTLHGIRYAQEHIDRVMDDNSRRMTQILRMLRILCGADVLPTSPKQTVNYFHNHCNLPVIARSKKTGFPSLGKENLYKLGVKHQHPAIPAFIAYRELSKECGTLKFTPWITNEKEVPSN